MVDIKKELATISPYDDGLLTFIARRILYNTDVDNDDLISFYRGASEDKQYLIDCLFTALCGYSFTSLVKMYQPVYIYNIEWDTYGDDHVELPDKVNLPDYIRDDLLFHSSGTDIVLDYLEEEYGYDATGFEFCDSFLEVYDECPYEKQKGAEHER